MEAHMRRGEGVVDIRRLIGSAENRYKYMPPLSLLATLPQTLFCQPLHHPLITHFRTLALPLSIKQRDTTTHNGLPSPPHPLHHRRFPASSAHNIHPSPSSKLQNQRLPLSPRLVSHYHNDPPPSHIYIPPADQRQQTQHQNHRPRLPATTSTPLLAPSTSLWALVWLVLDLEVRNLPVKVATVSCMLI